MKNTNFKPLETFKHVVVLMLENRSFDNLLGYLYKPDELPEGKQFAGLYTNPDGYANPIPTWAEHPPGVNEVPVTRATDYHFPYPDPGEIYGHVNTQLFDTFNPSSNRGKSDKALKWPYNRPSPGTPAQMQGFVTDYASVLSDLKSKHPTAIDDGYDGYKRIMECFQPDQIQTLSTLAKEFAVYDHWFCSVPSQTWCNRAFWHAGSSWGLVLNGPNLNWIVRSKGRTLFNQLEDKELDWKIYHEEPFSFTALIHLRALDRFWFGKHFGRLDHFLSDAQQGTLPAYSFLEPRFFTPHNDQHPSSYDSHFYGEAAVGSVLLGDMLINQIYNAVRTSPAWKDTLLIITHDEHGGCYDHVVPPTAVAPSNKRGQHGFRFDRLGVRVPMVMVSAHIQPQTIINTQHDHTSFLKTMGKKWGLADLTPRVTSANLFEEAFTPEVRDISTWPVIADPVLPVGYKEIDFSDAPLNHLQETILKGLAATEHGAGQASRISEIKTAGEALLFMEALYKQARKTQNI